MIFPNQKRRLLYLITTFVENSFAAIESMQNNKFRTYLTFLGIIIGVAAVILVGAASKSGKVMIFKELETFGLKSIWIFKSIPEAQNPAKNYSLDKGITIRDVDMIRKKNKLIQNISPVIESRRMWVKYKNRYSRSVFLAVTSEYKEINSEHLILGRFISKNDVQQRLPVCVIGIKIKNRLFNRKNPINKTIKIDGIKYVVIGVLQWKDRDFLASIGSAGGQDANTRVIVPISVFQHKINSKEIDYIQAKVIDVSIAKKAAGQIIDLLNSKYKGKHYFKSETMQQYIETTDNILNIVSWIGGIAAIVSLVVGGIGIMNITMTSVIERTKEIGLRIALGAKSNDILMLFLIESTIVGLFGGLIGICIGLLSIYGLQLITLKKIEVAFEYVFIAFFISLIIGIASGIYPAKRASKMDPVEALRHE